MILLKNENLCRDIVTTNGSSIVTVHVARFMVPMLSQTLPLTSASLAHQTLHLHPGQLPLTGSRVAGAGGTQAAAGQNSRVP